MISGGARDRREGKEFCISVTNITCRKRFLAKRFAAVIGAGLLGKNILGSGLEFRVASVCQSRRIHLRRGERADRSHRGTSRGTAKQTAVPRGCGLWQKQPVINNVETFINVPQILSRGVEWYKTAGRKRFARVQVC